MLRRTLLAELALGAAVIGVTGALAGYPPSTASGSGPFSTSSDIGPAKLELTLEPASVGSNELHLYLFSKRDGSQYDAVEELEIDASLPSKGIEPIDLAPSKAGPGHYVVQGATFGLAGEWTLRISARVSEFDAHEARIDIPID